MGTESDKQERAGGVTIREWAADDLPTIRRITWETWVATYAAFIPVEDLRSYFEEHYSVEALAELMASTGFTGLLALEGDSPAGYAKVKFNAGENRCYVSSLYILPGFQGKGIGGRLLATGEEYARGHGVGEIWLGVMVQNTNALAWYRKIGFQFVEEAPFTMGGTTVNHLIGYRPINNSR